ncbi:MAG: hypothetical protein HY904_00545 [Deltaproteobacteria bacterium]|nr:hypothetical protein [Deltaproteobacteria bacterium]
MMRRARAAWLAWCAALALGVMPAAAAGTTPDPVPVGALLQDLPAGGSWRLGLVVRPAPERFPAEAVPAVRQAVLTGLERHPGVAGVVEPTDLQAADMQLAQEAAQHGLQGLVVVRFQAGPPAAVLLSLFDGQGVELRQVETPLHAEEPPTPAGPAAEDRPAARVPPAADEPVEDSGGGRRWGVDAVVLCVTAACGVIPTLLGLVAGAVGLGIAGVLGQPALAEATGAQQPLRSVAGALCLAGCCLGGGGALVSALGVSALGARWGFFAAAPATAESEPSTVIYQENVDVEDHDDNGTAGGSGNNPVRPRPAPQRRPTTPNPAHGGGGGGREPRAHGPARVEGPPSRAPPAHNAAPQPPKKKEKEKEKKKPEAEVNRGSR